jgi:hypothetical protein
MSRAFLLTSIGVALVIGCRQHVSRSASEARPRRPGGHGVVTRLRVDTVGGAVRFALAVHNESDRRVELDFPDGQTHDFVVQDSAGRAVWRWSAGRLFTQGMQNRLVEAGDSVVFDEAWAPGAPSVPVGQYVVRAELRSENYPVRTTTRFALR